MAFPQLDVHLDTANFIPVPEEGPVSGEEGAEHY